MRYAVLDAPPEISLNRLRNTVDTASRIWWAALASGLIGTEAEDRGLSIEVGIEESPSVIFRYLPTDHPSNWDVVTSGGTTYVTLHRSVNGTLIDWKNQRYLFYFLANIIGVDLHGLPASSVASDLRWRPDGFEPSTTFPHLPSPNDGAIDLRNLDRGTRPLFTVRASNGPGYRLVVGWDSARKYESQGISLTFRGRVFAYTFLPYNPAEPRYQTWKILPWHRSSGERLGYEKGTGNCIDWSVTYSVNGTMPNWQNLGFESLAGTENALPNQSLAHHELLPLYAARFHGQETMGYQIVYGRPMIPACFTFLGFMQTGRYTTMPSF